MKFTIVEESALDSFFHSPYNPPVFSDRYTPDDFSKEYWTVHGMVRTVLSQRGREHDSARTGDFAMNESRGHSRWLQIELTSKKLWGRKLVPTISAALDTAPQAYMVYVNHNLIDTLLFHILLTRSEAFGACEDKTLLRRFGF